MNATSDPARLLSDFAFSPSDRERLERALGAEQVRLVSSHEALRQALIEGPAPTILSTFRPPADSLDLAPDLRWIALPSAGADGPLRAGLVRPDGPIVTSARGVYSVPIAEYVLSLMLIWARHWPELLAIQRAGAWPQRGVRSRFRAGELAGATLGVVGLGSIGREIARRARVCGMRVVATRRGARAGEADADADLLLPAGDLDLLLAQADYVVLAVPETTETAHLMDRPRLARMRPTAYLINVGRGSAINEADLVHALESGLIAGAGLDVFEVEPLPESSPLWRLPNVIVTPHISGITSGQSERFTDLFLDNLARFRAGEPLANVVDPARGY